MMMGSLIISSISAQNNSTEIYPVLFKDFIVKNVELDGDKEILLYDWKKDLTYNISNNDLDDVSPVVHGDYILWKALDKENMALYLYDFEEENFLKIPCKGEISEIKIVQQKISWICKENEKYTIQVFDIPTSKTISIPIKDKAKPGYDINDEYLVWNDNLENDHEIFLYHLTSGKIEWITNNDKHDIDPVVNGNFIAWTSEENGNSEILLYDLQMRMVKNISEDNAEDNNAMISQRYVIWQKNDGAQKNIFKYDLYNGSTEKISDHVIPGESVQLLNDYIIWFCKDDDAPHYCFYNLKNTTLTQYALHDNPNALPLLDGRKVEWHVINEITPKDLITSR